MSIGPTRMTDRQRRIAAPLVIACAGVLVYLNALHAPFVFDDVLQVERNLGLRSWAGVMRMLAEDSRPLTGLSLALNYALGGLNVVGYHVFNVAAHVAAALALYALVARTMLLAGVGDERVRRGAAAVAATAWVVHPLTTAAVTYTIQRAEVMMALGFLLALLAAARQWQATDRRASAAWSVAAIAAMALGAGGKQVIVVLPFVLIAYDWVFLRPGSLRAWLNQRAGILAGFTVVEAWLIWNLLDIATNEASISAGLNVQGVTPMGYAMSQPGVILHYLRLCVWPDVLVFDYAWPVATTSELATRVVPQALAVAALLGASLVGLARRRWWGFCGFAFFAILAPTSSFMPAADLAVEHRVYLPLACVVTLLTVGAGALLRRRAGANWARTATVAAAGVALVLAARTVMRNADFSSQERLWRTVVNARPQNARAWVNLGQTLVHTERRDEAITCFENAIHLNPEFADAHNNLGSALTDTGRPDEALPHHARAIELRPNMGLAYNNLGVALAALERRDEAVAAYRRAIDVDPSCEPAYLNLGSHLQRGGDVAGAIAMYEKALAFAPDNPATLSNMAAAFSSRGELDRAILYYERWAKASPDDPDPWAYMAFACRRLNRPDDARRAAERAIERFQRRGDAASAAEFTQLFLTPKDTAP